MSNEKRLPDLQRFMDHYSSGKPSFTQSIRSTLLGTSGLRKQWLHDSVALTKWHQEVLMQLVTDQSAMTAILEWKTIKHDPYIDHAHELGLDPMQVYEAPNGERATGREIAKMHYYR